MSHYKSKMHQIRFLASVHLCCWRVDVSTARDWLERTFTEDASLLHRCRLPLRRRRKGPYVAAYLLPKYSTC